MEYDEYVAWTSREDLVQPISHQCLAEDIQTLDELLGVDSIKEDIYQYGDKIIVIDDDNIDEVDIYQLNDGDNTVNQCNDDERSKYDICILRTCRRYSVPFDGTITESDTVMITRTKWIFDSDMGTVEVSLLHSHPSKLNVRGYFVVDSDPIECSKEMHYALDLLYDQVMN